MLFLGIGKDSLNGFLAFGIKIFVFRGVSGVIGQFFVVFPNMAQDSFYAVFRVGAQVLRRALGTDLRMAAIFPVTVAEAASQTGSVMRLIFRLANKCVLSTSLFVQTLCLDATKQNFETAVFYQG